MSAPGTVHPKPPAAVEQMVGMSSKHLVENVLGHKPRDGDYDAQRRYKDLLRFYVGANFYDRHTAIGEHTDSNPLYAVPPKTKKWS